MRLVEKPASAYRDAQNTHNGHSGQFGLRTIPIIAAFISSTLLAYFVLSGGQSEPLAQQQLPPREAQQHLAQNGAQPQQQAQPQTPAGPLPSVPSDDVLLLLIRAALIALNQANV